MPTPQNETSLPTLSEEETTRRLSLVKYVMAGFDTFNILLRIVGIIGIISFIHLVLIPLLDSLELHIAEQDGKPSLMSSSLLRWGVLQCLLYPFEKTIEPISRHVTTHLMRHIYTDLSDNPENPEKNLLTVATDTNSTDFKEIDAQIGASLVQPKQERPHSAFFRKLLLQFVMPIVFPFLAYYIYLRETQDAAPITPATNASIESICLVLMNIAYDTSFKFLQGFLFSTIKNMFGLEGISVQQKHFHDLVKYILKENVNMISEVTYHSKYAPNGRTHQADVLHIRLQRARRNKHDPCKIDDVRIWAKYFTERWIENFRKDIIFRPSYDSIYIVFYPLSAPWRDAAVKQINRDTAKDLANFNRSAQEIKGWLKYLNAHHAEATDRWQASIETQDFAIIFSLRTTEITDIDQFKQTLSDNEWLQQFELDSNEQTITLCFHPTEQDFLPSAPKIKKPNQMSRGAMSSQVNKKDDTAISYPSYTYLQSGLFGPPAGGRKFRQKPSRTKQPMDSTNNKQKMDDVTLSPPPIPQPQVIYFNFSDRQIPPYVRDPDNTNDKTTEIDWSIPQPIADEPDTYVLFSAGIIAQLREMKLLEHAKNLKKAPEGKARRGSTGFKFNTKETYRNKIITAKLCVYGKDSRAISTQAFEVEQPDGRVVKLHIIDTLCNHATIQSGSKSTCYERVQARGEHPTDRHQAQPPVGLKM